MLIYWKPFNQHYPNFSTCENAANTGVSAASEQAAKLRVDSFAAYACEQQNVKACLFVSHLDYAYGVSDKLMARSRVHTYFIGYFDVVNSDYFSQRKEFLLKYGRIAFSRSAKMQI